MTTNIGSWAEVAAPLELDVRCEGGVHRLRWSAGRVETVDHHDLDAERALVAFGGAEPACLSMLRLWDDAVADGGFLEEWVDEARLSDAWFSWLTMALERMRAEGFHEFLRGLPPARALRMGEFLHGFPPAWIDRAAATVAGAVEAGHDPICDEAHALIDAAVASRLRTAFVRAVGGRQLAIGAAALVPLQIEVGSGGVDPAIDGRLSGPGRGIAVTVDRAWLHRVWAVGAAVVDGRLVLARGGHERTAIVVGWGSDDRPQQQMAVVDRGSVVDDGAGDGRWRIVEGTNGRSD